MSWFEKIVPSRIKTERRTRSVPEGLWIKCPACDAVLYRAELERNLNVCPKCSHHMRIGARERLRRLLDPGTGVEIGADVQPEDPLRFKDSKRYKDRLAAAQKSTGEKRCADRDGRARRRRRRGRLRLRVPVPRRLDGLGGRRALHARRRPLRSSIALPLVCFSASGGARMQEALLSLMQMAKTSAALARLAQAHLPFISVLTDPTTGGVSASLAMLGDLNIAEPRALIGFAGPRVIQQTVRETLPEGFQRSEFLLEHGAIDMIVDRRDMRDRLVAAAAHADGAAAAAAAGRAATADRPTRAMAASRSAHAGRLAAYQQQPARAQHRPRPRARARGRAAPRAAAAAAVRWSSWRAPTARGPRSRTSRRCSAAPRACASATFTSPHLVRYNERIRVRRRSR